MNHYWYDGVNMDIPIENKEESLEVKLSLFILQRYLP